MHIQSLKSATALKATGWKCGLVWAAPATRLCLEKKDPLQSPFGARQWNMNWRQWGTD